MTTNEKRNPPMSVGFDIAIELSRKMFASDDVVEPLPPELHVWLANRITEAVNAARVGALGDGWRPIDAAPKDDQPVLLKLDRGKLGDIHRAPIVAYWKKREGWRDWHHDRPIAATAIAWKSLTEIDGPPPSP